MSERKFSKAVGKPGMAAQVRETVSQVVKDSAQVSHYFISDYNFFFM